jgi:hypothetical protein
MQFGDTAKLKMDNKEGEYIIEDVKFANFKYHNFWLSSSADIDIFARKITSMSDQSKEYGIEMSGHTTRAIGTTSSSEYISGIIWEKEIDRAIHALQYIKDSLLSTTPVHEIDYFINLKESEVKISAFTFGGDKAEWDVMLWLDKYNSNYAVTVKPKDVADLLTAFKMGKEKIKALK